MKAIIIGSGIGGLSCAIALRRIGCEVVLYERAPALGEVGAGISLWANAMRALDRIGAGDAVRAVALPASHSEIRGRDGHRVQIAYELPPLEKKYGMPPIVSLTHRAELVNALASCLPSDIAKYGHELESCIEQNGRMIAMFRNGPRDDADILIGADGIHSAVRASLFDVEKPRYAGYTCWRGICPRPRAIEPGYVGEWWGRGSRIGITTLTHDRCYWWATLNTPPGERQPDEQAFLAKHFAGWANPVLELIETTPTHAVLRNDIVDRPPMRTWSKGRAVLIGDAAHPTTPNLGQGGCMAIEDAAVLARCLRAVEPIRAFENFAAERSARTRSITRESWRFGKIAQWSGGMSCWMRDLLMSVTPSFVSRRFVLKYSTFDVGEVPEK